MHRGYIKLWRKSFDSGLHRDHKTWALWTYILCNVTYKEIDININGKIVGLVPGQMITGRKKLSRELRISERGIRTRLKHLKNYGNLTIKTTNKFSVISVSNWGAYQQDDIQNDQQRDQQVTSKRPASDHKQEVKKNKNIKNTNNRARAWPKDFVLTEKMRAYAKNKGVVKIDAFFDDFRDWAAAKGATYKDWPAAFRTRVGKAPEYGKQFMSQISLDPDKAKLTEGSRMAAERLKRFQEGG